MLRSTLGLGLLAVLLPAYVQGAVAGDSQVNVRITYFRSYSNVKFRVLLEAIQGYFLGSTRWFCQG